MSSPSKIIIDSEFVSKIDIKWKDWLRSIIEHDSTSVYIHQDELEDRILHILTRKLRIDKEKINLTSNLSHSEKHAFIEPSEKTQKIFKSIIKIGILLQGSNLNEKIEFYRKNNFIRVLSKFLPDELEDNVSIENRIYFLSKFYFIPPPKDLLKFDKISEKRIVVIIDENSDTNISENNFLIESLKNTKICSVYSTSDLESSGNIEYENLVISFSKDPVINHALLNAIPDDGSLRIASDTLPSPFRLTCEKSYRINQTTYLHPNRSSIREIFSINQKAKVLWDVKSNEFYNTEINRKISLEKFIHSLSRNKDSLLPNLQDSGMEITHTDTTNRNIKITNIQKNYYYEDFPLWLKKEISLIMVECWANLIADSSNTRFTPFDEFIIDTWVLIHATDLSDCAYKNFVNVIDKNIDIQERTVGLLEFVYSSNAKYESLITSICRKFLKSKYRDIFIRLENVNDSTWFNKNKVLLKREISCGKPSRETISNLLIHYAVVDDFENADLICKDHVNKTDLNFLSLHYAAVCILRKKHDQARTALGHYDSSDRTHAVFTVFYIFINIALGNNNLISDEISYLLKRDKIINISSKFGTYQFLTIIQLYKIRQLNKIVDYAKDIIIDSGIMTELDINELKERSVILSINESLIDSIAKFSNLLNLSE